jgi:hypothetical protein
MTTQPASPLSHAVADVLRLHRITDPLPDAPTCNLTFTVDGRSMRIVAEMGNALPGVCSRQPGTLFLLVPTATLYRNDETRDPSRMWTELASGIDLGNDILMWSQRETDRQSRLVEGSINTADIVSGTLYANRISTSTNAAPGEASNSGLKPVEPAPVNPPLPTRGKRRTVK